MTFEQVPEGGREEVRAWTREKGQCKGPVCSQRHRVLTEHPRPARLERGEKGTVATDGPEPCGLWEGFNFYPERAGTRKGF